MPEGNPVSGRIRGAEDLAKIEEQMVIEKELVAALLRQIDTYKQQDGTIAKRHQEEVDAIRALVKSILDANRLAREQITRGRKPSGEYLGAISEGDIRKRNSGSRMYLDDIRDLIKLNQKAAESMKVLNAETKKRLRDQEKEKGGLSKDASAVIGMMGGRFGGLASLVGGAGGLTAGIIALKQSSSIVQDAMKFSDNLMKFGVDFRETMASPGGRGGAIDTLGSSGMAIKLDTMISVMSNNTVNLKDLNKTIMELRNLGGAGIPLFEGGMSANQIFEGLATTQKTINRGQSGSILSRMRFDEQVRAGRMDEFGGGSKGYTAYRQEAGGRLRAAESATNEQTLMLNQLAAFQVGISALSRASGMSEGGLLKHGVTLNRTTTLFDNMKKSVGDLMPKLTEEMKTQVTKNKLDKKSLTAMEGANLAATLAAVGFKEFNLPQEEFVNNITSAYQSARLFGLSMYELISIGSKEKEAMRAMVISYEDITQTMNTMFSPGVDQAALMMEYLRNNLSQFSDLAPLTNMNQLDAMGLLQDLAQVPTEWLDELENRRVAGEDTEPVKMWTTYMQGAGLKSIADFKNLQSSARLLSSEFGGGFIDMIMGGKNMPGSGFLRRDFLGEISPGMKMGKYTEQLTTAETQKAINDIASGVALTFGEQLTRKYAEEIVKTTNERDFPAEFAKMAEVFSKSIQNLILNGPVTITGLIGSPNKGVIGNNRQ